MSGDDEDGFLYAVAGPSLQYWINDWFWASAGAGVAMRARSVDFGPYHSSFGVGLDGRLGATLDQGTHHTFSLAIEISPIFFFHPSQVDGLASSYAVATLVLGYQYL